MVHIFQLLTYFLSILSPTFIRLMNFLVQHMLLIVQVSQTALQQFYLYISFLHRLLIFNLIIRSRNGAEELTFQKFTIVSIFAFIRNPTLLRPVVFLSSRSVEMNIHSLIRRKHCEITWLFTIWLFFFHIFANWLAVVGLLENPKFNIIIYIQISISKIKHQNRKETSKYKYKWFQKLIQLL